MSSYRQILYHIVFRTKDSKRTLPLADSDELYKYIWGITQQKDCVLYRVNGMEEHIHIFSDLHPTVALAGFLQKIKTASSLWLKKNSNFPRFCGWAEGYAALTYSSRDKEMITNYIVNQREHHAKTSFLDEYRAMLEEAGVVIDERYFP